MNGKGSATAANSGVHWKSGEVVSDKFPVGLRVLVVDDDPTCLMILEKMLQTCLYEATKCNRAEVALSLLRENKNGFDIVLSDVHMPDMDGFKLLEHVGLEMDLPVIMMSADDSQHVVMKGVTHGACDYLIKPVRIEALKNIWQHVVRKRKNEWKDGEQSGSVEDGDRQQKQSEDADYSSSANEGNWKNSKKRKEDEDEVEDRDDTSTLKKPRVVWAVELHQQFVAAVNQLGIDKAVPKKILELMSVPGLTRENVASHLQKYRLYLRRVSAQHPGGLNTPFMTHQEAAFASLSSMNALDLQSLASSGQLPSQSLATIQAAALGRSTAKSGITMPGISPKNLFSFENSNLRFGERQPLNNNNAKQISLLHGVPTSIEPKQLASLHPSAQTFGSMNMQINPRGGQNNGFLMQTRGLIPNENTIGHIARVPPISQPILSNGITSGGLTRNVMAETGRGAVYSQAGINFPPNPNADPPGNFFQLGSASGLSTHTSKGVFQEEPNSEIKGSRGFVGSYDIFGEQPKSQEWGLQNVGMTYSSQQASPVQDNLDVLSSVLVQQQQGVPSCQSSLQNCSMAVVGPENGNMNIFSQHLNPLLVDNSSRIKAERIPHSNSGPAPFSNHYSQEDLMNAFFRQQQDCITPAEGEFDFDGYSLDNIPV